MTEWRRQLADAIHTVSDLEALLPLYPDEKAYFDTVAESRLRQYLPFAVTPYYLSLIGSSRDDPLRRQAIPLRAETMCFPYETHDPLDEVEHRPLPSLVHRYPGRVLIKLTDACAGYCRHCFRRVFAGSGSRNIGMLNLGEIGRYLSEHEEIREVILSGGDPLILSDDQLKNAFSAIRESAPRVSLRIHSRVPAVLPMRIDRSIAAIMHSYSPLWMVIQTNHPKEITDEYLKAVGTLGEAGVPVLNQTVLLRGVNDNADVLEELFIGLTRAQVKPYYLFQGDLAQGTAHLRVPLKRGLEIARDLRSRLSGVEYPTYAVDLPGGGGKIDLLEAHISGPIDGFFVIIGRDGNEYLYPNEE